MIGLVHVAQRGALRGRRPPQPGQQVRGDRAGLEGPAVGVPVRHRRQQLPFAPGGRRHRAQLHAGEQSGLGRIGQQADHRQVAGLPDRQAQPEKGCAAAEQQLPAGRVEAGQQAVRVSGQVQPVRAGAEPPWLGVVQ